MKRVHLIEDFIYEKGKKPVSVAKKVKKLNKKIKKAVAKKEDLMKKSKEIEKEQKKGEAQPSDKLQKLLIKSQIKTAGIDAQKTQAKQQQLILKKKVKTAKDSEKSKKELTKENLFLEKDKLEWHDSEAPDANGRFKDLSPKDLAAWLIKTRKGDMKKISGSLSQQVAFNKNDDKEYVKKMDKTRKEVYKQLDRDDLLENTINKPMKNFHEQLDREAQSELYEAKPGPDPYHRGLDDEDVEDKEDQIKKQADMDDGDPDAYKEMPGDKAARKNGEVKTSKATKRYSELYGDEENESLSFLDFLNEAEKYITDEFKVGDKIKTGFGEWEVIETDYAPKKSFMGSFIFKGKDMKRVNIPSPPKTNKNAVGYKVTDGDKYPIIGFLYQYKDITKLATVGVDESFVNEEKIKYAKGKTYQSSGHWTVVVDSNSSGLDIRVNHSAGWRLSPHDEREETFELLDNGRQRATLNFKSGNIDKFAQQMFDLNNRTTNGNQTKLTAKDYADIIRVWIDMRKANESVNEGMSKSAIKKQIKIIDQQIEDEEGGDGEPLTSETLQDLERERERLLALSESNINEEKAEGDRGPLDDDKIETGLKTKAKESGVPIDILRIIMRRGLAAWKSGHRPGATQQMWGYARVNAFLTKGEGTWGGADSDVAKEVRDGGYDKGLKEDLLVFEAEVSLLNEEDTYNDYPAAAKKNAQKAIDWKEEHGRDEVDAGTAVGWARANQLAKGENLSADTVGRMSAFNRHRKNSSISAEHKATPWKDKGYVSWLIWGGDEGVDWATEKMKEIKR
tara:strand:+ start:906 stop:3275 length:2370 start_codon:yes stop_codon:yes gene_type:complete